MSAGISKITARPSSTMMNRSKYSVALIRIGEAHVLFPLDQELDGKWKRDEVAEQAADKKQQG